MTEKLCCTPPNAAPVMQPASNEGIQPATEDIRAELRVELVRIPGGTFDMGELQTNYSRDGESPQPRVKVSEFLAAPYAVTNAAFARFVSATGYKTVAQQEGWSFVFHLFLDEPERYGAPQGLPWWRKVEGACWTAPEGPGSSIVGRESHPAIHISWYDATAYCAWSGLRLLSEAEWEYAARGNLQRARFPWGNTLVPSGQHAMNVWQGDFPNTNTAEDGYVGTAPVNAFAPNAFGMFNMTGNVWEWVETTFDRGRTAPGPVLRTQRGGSYLCHSSYCDRYHVHSRTGAEPESSAGHAGFRVAANM